MKHIICYSGGSSSGKVALNVWEKYPNDEIILLNHDINENVEDKDIKRFKEEVAKIIGVNITYANYKDLNAEELPDQFDVSIESKGFGFGFSSVQCTYKLKTLPFHNWLEKNIKNKDEVIIYYGFDINEKHRIQRRSSILGEQGYKTDYPLALWKDVDNDILEKYKINPPLTYGVFKHANCVGCLKAGKQHWYVVYATRKDIWNKAKETENIIGNSILKEGFLEEFEEEFKLMLESGVVPTEKIVPTQFWKQAKEKVNNRHNLKLFDFLEDENKPCECTF